MRIKNFGMGLLVAAGSLVLGSAAFAGVGFLDTGRLSGDFSTMQDGQTADGNNEACFSFGDEDAEVDGEVRGVSGGCTAFIFYDTDAFHKASGSTLKPGKTSGTGKLQQQIFSDVEVGLFDTDGVGPGTCAEAFNSFARPEKCSVKSSAKGTQVANTFEDEENDTVTQNKVQVKCDLGTDLSGMDTDLGTAGVQAPLPASVSTVLAAFTDRKDVKLTDKGQLSIKHDGVPEAAAATPFCD